jgi:hypothetical protein
MANQIDRRGFLGTAVVATSVAAISQPLLGTGAFADYAVAPAKRRALSGLAANDPIIVGYKRGVAAMKALPDSDPCSWKAQAAIHWPGLLGVAGPCEHGDLFWAWHRMYLYWFERIVRHKSGMYDWALPYWDYDWETTVSSLAQRQIPVPFRVPAVPANALYDPLRDTAMNIGAGALSAATTATSAGFSPTAYLTAQSMINGTPHGAVHGAVGGSGGDMSYFSTAGLDPIFWTHHCNIDRLWNLWLAKGGGRSSPISDAAWRGHTFTFYDECCKEVHMTPCDVLRAAQQLSYVYEFEPAQVNQQCTYIIKHPPWDVIFAVRLAEPFVLDGKVSTLPLLPRSDREGGGRLMSLAKNPVETIILQFKGVTADRHPGAMWEVYVGLPPNAKASAESPFFVGNVAMFGDGIKGEGHHAGEFNFPLNRALRAMSDLSTLQVTLVPSSGVVVEERPTAVDVKAPVRVGEVNLLRDNARPEEEQPKRRQ